MSKSDTHDTALQPQMAIEFLSDLAFFYASKWIPLFDTAIGVAVLMRNRLACHEEQSVCVSQGARCQGLLSASNQGP